MATLILTVPDDLGERLQALSRETLKQYAIPALRDAADAAEEANLTPVRRADLPEAHIAAIEAGLADSRANRVIDGETVLSELRQLGGRSLFPSRFID